MASREFLSNYIYILNYENNYLHALDTSYMVACRIYKEDLINIANNKKVDIRNIGKQGILRLIHKTHKVVLFKCDGDSYIVADYYCNLNKMTLSDIKEHKEEFPDIKFVGRGITTNSGKIPNVTKRVLDIYKMQNFNTKADMLGISTLKYDFDYDNRLIITSIQNERDILEIPSFVYGISNRAFASSNIKHANIGNSIKVVSSNAFANCVSLESVKFGKSVEIIECRAFFNCKRLKTISVNDRLREIQLEAFNNSGITLLNNQSVTLKVDETLRNQLRNYTK